MDDATWAALAATLTVAGLIWTWIAFRRRGAANGLRALGFAVLPAAAWLTGTLQMLTEITRSVSRWASGLVLDPFTWAGIGLAGLAVVLFVVSGLLRDRQLARGQAAGGGQVREPPSREKLPPSSGSRKGTAPVDDELADIEALLRKRGIQ